MRTMSRSLKMGLVVLQQLAQARQSMRVNAASCPVNERLSRGGLRRPCEQALNALAVAVPTVAVCIRPSMRVLKCRVGREGRIGQGVQKGNQLRLLDGVIAIHLSCTS